MHDKKFLGAPMSKRATLQIWTSNASCDLENEVKVKYSVWAERPCHGWYFDTIKHAYLFKPFAIQPFLFPIGLTLEKWTFAYKSEVEGRSDLIFWLQVPAALKCLHARLEVSWCTDVNVTPNVTDGRTPSTWHITWTLLTMSAKLNTRCQDEGCRIQVVMRRWL